MACKLCCAVQWFSVRPFGPITQDYPCTPQADSDWLWRLEVESQVIDPYKAIWLVLDVIKIIEHNHNNVYQPHNCFIVLQPWHAGLGCQPVWPVLSPRPHQSHHLPNHQPSLHIIIIIIIL